MDDFDSKSESINRQIVELFVLAKLSPAEMEFIEGAAKKLTEVAFEHLETLSEEQRMKLRGLVIPAVIVAAFGPKLYWREGIQGLLNMHNPS